MSLTDFFYGAGAIVLGTLIGTLLTAWLTRDFQAKLLQRQLDFQREQAAADARQRKEISDQMLGAIEQVGKHLKFQIGSSGRAVAQAVRDAQPPSEQ